MITTVLQIKTYNVQEPIKKFCAYDPTNEEDKASSYLGNKILSKLVGRIVVSECVYRVEQQDIQFQSDVLKDREVTKLIKMRVSLAPTEDIINKAYMVDKCFRDTIAKDVLLHTKSGAFVLETDKGQKEIEVGQENADYGHIYEFKKKNLVTGRAGNLGYDFEIFFNPHIYKFSDVLLIAKDLFAIE